MCRELYKEHAASDSTKEEPQSSHREEKSAQTESRIVEIKTTRMLMIVILPV